MENNPPVLSRRLSQLDAGFLYLERKEIPLSIGCVALFDGPIPFRDFVAHINSKLDQIPRYRQVVVPPPLNLGYPTWEDDLHFDIKRHIFRVRLKAPGGEAELSALAGELMGTVLDRGKPLWEFHVVEGLKDGRGAMIARIHHALADGVAGAALLRIMMDSTPEGSRVTAPPDKAAAAQRARRSKGGAPPRVEPGLTEQLASAIQSSLENVVAAEAGLLSVAQGLLSEQGKTAMQGLATLLPELLRPAERFSFNKPCSGDRKFCWTEANFADVRAIRAAVGGKVNDCIVSVVVRAISRYIELRGEKVKGRFLRVVCPVNVRGDENGESLGNRITFLPVVLPLDIRDPVEMLHAVARRIEIMKNARAAELVALLASCVGTAPAPLQELFWRGLPQIPLPVPLLNVICTNVSGSPTPLYAVGRRMLASYPQVPTGYELGVGIAVQSYDGKLCFGLIADAHVASDVERLRDYIRTSFEDLAKAAGLRSRPGSKGARARPTPKDRPVRKPATRAVPEASPAVQAPADNATAKMGVPKRPAGETAGAPQEAMPAAPPPTPLPAPNPIRLADAIEELANIEEEEPVLV